ncbi:hypothetical protein VB636_20925 [Paracoccus sp. APAP_BH8]|uniref:hypothetical protein n=1 Tax=Paracoccus sp. APAP_BH8 TaxID=3110237 RepID=UPI002FD83F5A
MAEEPDLIISAGFSDAQLVAESNKVVAEFRKRGEEAQKAFQDAQGRVTDTQAARAHARDLDRLARQYDPVYRAAKRYEEEVKRLDRALDVGAISQQRYTAEVAKAARQMHQAGETMQDTARKGQQMGTGWQNLGWQVGDFATQVGAGTSAAQALGQQLPQLLGGFGTLGALMGAGAAIAIPLGAALLKVAMDTETLDEKLDGLEKTTGAYLDAVEAAETPLEQLRLQYGDLADEIARVNELTATLTSVQARADLLGSARTFAGTVFPGEAVSRAPGLSDAEWSAVQEAQARKLARATGASVEQVGLLQMAMRRLETSNSIEAVQKDAENFRDVLIQISGSAEAAAQKFPEQMGTLNTLITSAADQLAAADRQRREAQQDLLETYDANTQKLKKLADERRLAEESQTEAVKAGKEDQAEAYGRVIKAIDKEVQAVRQSIAEMDGTFEASVKRMQELAGGLGGTINDAIKQWTGLNLREWGQAGTAANKGILDLIAQRESRGDYNATLDDGRWTGGARNLVNMTLREIRALQESMKTPENRALYGNGAGSSALGRYQIVGSTLDDLMKRLKLTGDELFTPELQDRLAMELLRQIKPGDVDGIRKVWAGLENVPAPLIQQAWGQQSISRVDPEVQKDLDKEIKDRERLAEQARRYGEQLAQNLLTEKETARLASEQADQIAAIKASGMDEEAQARAIAAVTAETERQRVVMTLLAEAKRRNVDLDALLADGSMTYKEAIEALGEAKKADIIATNERAIAEGKAAEAQQMMADTQQQVKQGLLDSVLAGESFADVLANVGKMFARAALEAALFNEGAWSSAGGGKGLLGGIVGAIFSGWSSGGYTGPGGKHEPAGIVHKGEVVWSQDDVRRAGGVGVVEAMRRGSRLPGLADGGVAAMPMMRLPQIPIGAAAPRGTAVNATFAPNISIAPGVTQAELGMTMAAARQEYERNFLPMLQKHMPSYNERYT